MLDLLFPIPVCKYFLKKAQSYKVLMGSVTEVSATAWSMAHFQICILFLRGQNDNAANVCKISGTTLTVCLAH